MSGKPCMASEMLSPGNVDIAIKGTVWISQGVPCPVCQLSRVTQSSLAESGKERPVSEGRLSGEVRWRVVSMVSLGFRPLVGPCEVIMV